VRSSSAGLLWHLHATVERHAVGAEPSNVRIAVASREPPERVAAYLMSHSFAPDVIVTLGPNDGFKIRRTPAILVLDERRIVKALWYGRIKASDEELVQKQLLF